MCTVQRKRAAARIRRDIIELERSQLSSVAAVPLETDIFEWHVNICPSSGVYTDNYFHLIMTFPDSYPSQPPSIKMCTPISHPNVFGGFICLSMLRPGTGNHPYEGWSASYSIASILRQLQSFLFATKIEQDSGSIYNAKLSNEDVRASIVNCKRFECSRCSHSQSSPFPVVHNRLVVAESRIRLRAIKQFEEQMSINHNTSCQSTGTRWVSVYYSGHVNAKMSHSRVFYEAFISWTGGKWQRNNIKGGLSRFGFGNRNAKVVGIDHNSFGYGGTAKWSHCGEFTSFGETFAAEDIITVALDFESKNIYFCKNGRMMDYKRYLAVDDTLWTQDLFPMVSFKNSRIEFNFGKPKAPCPWLVDNDFRSFDELRITDKGEEDYKEMHLWDKPTQRKADWKADGMIDEIWMSIFECLEYEQIYKSQFVCKIWHHVINKFNVFDRNQVYCYFTKRSFRAPNTILGIAVNIQTPMNKWGKRMKSTIESQMDYISLNAWKRGCRVGVWGESNTHFVPLVIDKAHAHNAHDAIFHHLTQIDEAWSRSPYAKQSEAEMKAMRKCKEFRLIDMVITIMNQLVVKFVMDNKDRELNRYSKKDVKMMFCDKVVLGYCYFHHLLLYLANLVNKKQNNFVTKYANNMVYSFVNEKNGSNKKNIPDLGKFLIYAMLADEYDWQDFAVAFFHEVMARNTLWIIKENPCLNTTNKNIERSRLSLKTTVISRRLVMFQCWFMRSNKYCTLKEYNHRLGRPSKKLLNSIQYKTQQILWSQSWADYLRQLKLALPENTNYHFDQMLTYAVMRSHQRKYHEGNPRFIENNVRPPHITYIGPVRTQPGAGNVDEEDVRPPTPSPEPLQKSVRPELFQVDDGQKEGQQKSRNSSARRRRRRRAANKVVDDEKVSNDESQPGAQPEEAAEEDTWSTSDESEEKANGNQINDVNKPVEPPKMSRAQRRKRRKQKKFEKREANTASNESSSSSPSVAKRVARVVPNNAQSSQSVESSLRANAPFYDNYGICMQQQRAAQQQALQARAQRPVYNHQPAAIYNYVYQPQHPVYIHQHHQQAMYNQMQAMMINNYNLRNQRMSNTSSNGARNGAPYNPYGPNRPYY